MTRILSASWVQLAITFALGLLIGGISMVELVPAASLHGGRQVAQNAAPDPSASAAPDPAATAGQASAGPGTTSSSSGGPGAGTGAKGPTASRPGLACAPGQNGGGTDTGVTGSQITLATTEVQDGVGAAFLGQVKYAMEALKNKVNHGGGICGRQLAISYVNDGWKADLGAQYLRNFIQQGVFAIPVGPSSEGLRVVVDSGDVDKAGIPVVGSDGMLIDQYKDPWVWPVAVSTASSARIMAKDAYDRGARKFSIVFDTNYRFGVEAAKAYDHEVRALTGHDIPGYPGDSSSSYTCQQSFCGVLANQSSYGPQVTELAQNTGDFLSMFLEPATAKQWMATPGAPTATGKNSSPKLAKGIGAGQPLFTYDFAVSCQEACDQMTVWTGYKPYIEEYKNDPAVQAYVSDLTGSKPDADQQNQFSEGGYVGMQLLIKALQQVGPELTRARLRAALDTTDLQSGLSIQPTLTFRAGNHFSNRTMQGFVIQYPGTFAGWRTVQGSVADPDPQSGTG